MSHKVKIALLILLIVIILVMQGIAWSIKSRQNSASTRAETLFEAGELEAAKEVLVEAWALDRDNTELREQMREINEAMVVRDSRKAHVLHGREGPGGELAPEDLMP